MIYDNEMFILKEFYLLLSSKEVRNILNKELNYL